MKNMAFLFLLLAILMTGCGTSPKETPTPLPTVVLDSNASTAPQTGDALSVINNGSVRASGVVIPAQEAQLASAIGGNIKDVAVTLGDQVVEGQVLITLSDTEGINAAVHAANLELLSAQNAYNDLFIYQDINKALARDALVAAQENLDNAQEDRESKDYDRASPETLDVARANLIIAEDAVKQKEIEYDQVDARPEEDPIRAEKFAQLASAKQNRNRLEANLNWLLGLPDELEMARADVDLALAEARLTEAERRWEDIKNDGIDDEQLALAEERLNQAEAQLDASQAALDQIEIKAPFDGTISRININLGEWALPGQTLLVLADLGSLRVETTDLSERDIPKVKIGQQVTVYIDALGLEIQGSVSEISPQADTLGGDVVYMTVIGLDERPDDLLAGMSADVFYDTGQ